MAGSVDADATSATILGGGAGGRGRGAANLSSIDTLIKLVNIVAIRCGPLEHLTLNWPFQSVSGDVAAQRCRALETVGDALFVPNSRVHIQSHAINLGALTEEDVAALNRGSREGGPRADRDVVGPRIHAVEWKPQTSPEAIIWRVVPLFASVGVRELELSVEPSRSLSCRTFKAVLLTCPQLTKLARWVLSCGDFTQLTDATWSGDTSSQLRALRLLSFRGDDADFISAVDALLARVGSQLARLALFTLHSALSARMANVVVARCPQLRELEVGYADAPFHDQLVRALDEDRCGAANFVTRSGPAGRGSEWTTLFHALKNPHSGASRTLRQLTVDAWQVQRASQNAVTQAFIEAVSSNATLQRGVVVADLRDAEKDATSVFAAPVWFSYPVGVPPTRSCQRW